MNIVIDSIDKVIRNATEVMENSKYQIYEISEGARGELKALDKELEAVMEELDEIIIKVDKQENFYRISRLRLVEVSKNFDKYTEKDIKSAYEMATALQLDIMVLREKEANLKARRDDLHKRQKNLAKTIERAESLVLQMDVVLDYLSGDLSNVTRILESAKNRQLLGLKIILAQEEERKRIAREIHDGPAQSMANLVLRAEIAERMLDKKEYVLVKEELNDLKGQVRSGLEDVRKIIFNLRPMALDDLGLVPILRKYMQDIEEKVKILTKFELSGKERRLPSAMEVALYRLVQEAITNVLKHANASYITLNITFQQNMIKILIQDNGKGFHVEHMESKIASGSHFGIMGMRERLELLEGRMDITSALDQGTQITMTIPIKE